jgi:hypothetical protein
MKAILTVSAVLAFGVLSSSAFASIIAYQDDFDGGQQSGPGITATWSGVTTLESVQGYAGYGNGGDVFGGDFLRNTTLQKSTLTLTGLPSHTSVSIGFLLGIIDSWDGASSDGNPHTYDDVFNVLLDGIPVFSHAFDEVVVGDTYTPPAGGLLVFYQQLGFDPYPGIGFFDSGYDLSLEPALQSIPHTSSTLTIDWFASGTGYGGSGDETWGIENLSVHLDGVAPVPEPSSIAIFGMIAVCGTLMRAFHRRR